MPKRNNLRNGPNDEQEQSQQNYAHNASSITQSGHSNSSKYESQLVGNRSSVERSWQYTNLDNVKVLYSAQDAKQYIQNMARTLEINNLEGVSNFIQEMCQRVDHVTKPNDVPLEFWHDGAHEKSYLLVLIETKTDRCEIGYSYHFITDVSSQSNSSSENMVMHEPQTLDWFRKQARRTLRVPASIVGYLITNNSSMRDSQQQQLSQPPKQRSMETLYGNNQEGNYIYKRTDSGHNDSNNTMSCRPFLDAKRTGKH